VFSPAGQLPALARDGWFLASKHLLRPAAFVPRATTVCGVLDATVVNALDERLQDFFWDSRWFTSART